MQTDLSRVEELARADHGLAVAVTQRPDGSPQVSVVNAAVTSHPADGRPVVAFVARGGTRKLANLRARPRATLVFRVGWEWVAVEGPVELVGPDDPAGGADPESVRLLLRQIFTDAGGQHDDLAEYDRVMLAERRTAVLIEPARIHSNPPSARHVEPT